jgi:hypothetical protein
MNHRPEGGRVDSERIGAAADPAPFFEPITNRS